MLEQAGFDSRRDRRTGGHVRRRRRRIQRTQLRRVRVRLPGPPPMTTTTATSGRDGLGDDGMTTTAPLAIEGLDRAELQRRTLRALASGQIVGAAALASAVTVGAFVIQDMLGQDTPWAGTATAMVTMGTALMAQVLSRRMQRRGRRPGLVLGYSLAAAGGLVAADRRREHVAGALPRRVVRVRERPGREPPRPLRRDRPRRARRAQPGDEPHRVRLDVRRRARAVDDRTHRTRRRGVVRTRPLHRAVVVRAPSSSSPRR